MSHAILVVDDEAPVRRLVARTLTNAGFLVKEAASADETMAALAKEQIPVMFLDLQLPGMNGIELCRRIRNEYPVSAVFALTGFASVFDLVECREAGFDDYFVKPFDAQVIVKAARDAFDRLSRWRSCQSKPDDASR